MEQYRKNLGKVSVSAEGLWDKAKSFDKLSIVYDEITEHAFLSKQGVPAGIDLHDSRYWMPLNVSGYSDSNIIIFTDKDENQIIKSYTLEDAIKSITSVGRKPGCIISFYNNNIDREGLTGRWEIWQFNSLNVYDWENIDNWINVYYNYNKFLGWFANEDFLKKTCPFPEIGCYAYVGGLLYEAFVYRCDNKHVWINTGINSKDYIKVVIDGNVTIGENGNWFSNGNDTGIKANIKGDNGKTPIFRNKNNIIEYSYDELTWYPISEEINVWFRWSNDNKIQITRDNISWEDLSPSFEINNRIQAYVDSVSQLPNGKPVGTVYGVKDSTHTNENPKYRIYVYTNSGWIDNGVFNGISAGVVNDLTTGGADKALSAEMGKELNKNSFELNSTINGITSVGKISLYPGISTSMSNNYPLSEIIPANKECNVVINIENNAIPTGAVYFRGENNNIITTITNARNGYSTTINLVEDAHYVSFSLTDSTITNTGDFIVNISAKSELAKIIEEQEDIKRDIVNAQEDIKIVKRIVTTLQSVGFISLYKGISTSSSTNYPLSEVIPANKECSINVIIENNAIPKGVVYFKDKDKKTLFTAVNVMDGYSLTKEFDADVHYVAFSLTDSTITGTGDFIVNLSVDSEIEKELKNVNSTLQIHSQRIDNLESSGGSGNSALISGTLSKEIINITRPYYFAQGWGVNDDFGYLDERLADVPQGKHFLIFSDIHLDYYNNYGFKQKQAIIMKYIHDRLNGCQVIYLGDFLGTQPTEGQAQKLMKWFTNEYYSLFGGNFVPALGDHDTDRVNGGLASGEQLTEEFIYNAYFKQAYNYGAVGDKAVDVINGLSLSDIKKESWKYYMKMHYYKDDPVNKVRTIIVQQGAVFRNIPDNYNCSGVQLPFIANAMATAPNDYAIVIASHEYHLNKTDSTVPSNYWETKLVALAKAFKNGESYTLTKPQFSVDEETMIWNAVSAEYPSVYDFNGKKGEVVILQGDEHFDYVSYCNGDTMMNVSAVDANPTDSDVLYVLVDRACTVENAGFPYSQFNDIEYTIKTMRRAKAGNLIGTTDEVLFDVMTINENGLTITRIGDTPEAGIVGAYEIFDSTKNYNVGDMVIWYEDVPETTSYRPYIYKFIRQHSASDWSEFDVEKVNIIKSYNRTYKI